MGVSGGGKLNKREVLGAILKIEESGAKSEFWKIKEIRGRRWTGETQIEIRNSSLAIDFENRLNHLKGEIMRIIGELENHEMVKK